MLKRFISLVIMMTFCSMQCAFAVDNYDATMSPIPNNTVISQSSQNNTTLYGSTTQFGKGKTLKAFLQNKVSTTDAVKGDPIVVILSEDWNENGKTIAEAGSVINGVISSSNSAGSWSKNGSLEIDFKTMETTDGQIYGLNAEKIDIQIENEKNSKWKSIAKAGGIIIAVAAVGALFGLMGEGNGTKYTTTTTTSGDTTTTTTKKSNDKDYGKDSATGAIIGAGIGAAIAIGVAATKKGDNITIPANTNFEIQLLDNVTLQSY